MGDDYVYLPLQDALSTIMDESFQQCGVTVNFFAHEAQNLPHVNSAGDIIRLHRILMKIHKQEVLGHYNKKFSSFALFEGRSGKDFSPYQASSRFQVTKHDKVCIEKLRTWLATDNYDSGVNEYSLQLRELKVGEYFDLICKVLHISKVSEEELILFVWDGTDAPPACFEIQLGPQSGSFPLQLEEVPLSRDILSTFPCIGTILRIVTGKSFDTLVHLKVLGQWVKFRNITCRQKFGLWEGLMVASSRIFLLSEQDNIPQCCQRKYDERLLHEVEHMSLWSFPAPAAITETQLEHVGLSTLMEILTHSKMTCKYKCIVRIIASYPWLAEDFRSPNFPHVYRIRFTLEDSTARIHAYLYGEDGVEFFEGCPPAHLLTAKMNKLLGLEDKSISEGGDVAATRNPPWVQVCIKSYYLDKNDPWGSRHYRICNTKIVG
ncbi:Protection of telomeres protein 1a [Nymphaea thermarum]|nr:Protection of telomeres protein 1a [Nymphaea thermarum]